MDPDAPPSSRVALAACETPRMRTAFFGKRLESFCSLLLEGPLHQLEHRALIDTGGHAFSDSSSGTRSRIGFFATRCH